MNGNNYDQNDHIDFDPEQTELDDKSNYKCENINNHLVSLDNNLQIIRRNFNQRIDQIEKQFGQRLDLIEQQNKKESRLRLYLLLMIVLTIFSFNFSFSGTYNGTSFQIDRRDDTTHIYEIINILAEIGIIGGFLGSGALATKEVFTKVKNKDDE